MINKRFESLKNLSDIVDTMIQGLKKEWVNVRMTTFGEQIGSTCFGCAATNTLCQLMGEPFPSSKIRQLEDRASYFNYQITIIDLRGFENAIDRLRIGDIDTMLYWLSSIKHLLPLEIPDHQSIIPPFDLPHLSTYNWREGLPVYEQYRDWLKLKGL